MDVTITDADYQMLEREQALEILTLRRERAVLVRRITELTAEGQVAWAEVARLERDLIEQTQALEQAASPAEPPAAPKARRRA